MKLEEAIKIMDLFVKNIAVENVKVFELKDACKVALQHIEHLQKENEGLKTGYLIGIDFDNTYISKDKIRELLEDYKKGVDCTYCNNTCSRYILCTNLQDLLKEE